MNDIFQIVVSNWKTCSAIGIICLIIVARWSSIMAFIADKSLMLWRKGYDMIFSAKIPEGVPANRIEEYVTAQKQVIHGLIVMAECIMPEHGLGDAKKAWVIAKLKELHCSDFIANKLSEVIDKEVEIMKQAAIEAEKR